MTGVKISLPVDPFQYQPLKPHPLLGGTVTGEMLSILPIEEIFTNEYLVNATIMFNKEIFIKKVEYINEDELRKKREEAVKYIQVDRRPMYQIEGPQKLAGYKSKQWEFQQEVRYILMIYPTPPLPPSGNLDSKWIEDMPKFLLKTISDGTGPNKEYFDITIDQNYFDNIRVTLAPHATEGDKIIVESLLEKYTKNGILSKSKLTNLIRQSTK
jgi:hypothetical protein